MATKSKSKSKASKATKGKATKGKQARRPDKKNQGRNNMPVRKPEGRGLPSAESRALGAMLQSERWYEPAMLAIAAAFYRCKGNASHAAAELGVSWRSLRDWCAEYPELQRGLEAARKTR
jgi:hypothetical protein